MPVFDVSLIRSFRVSIDAGSAEQAMRLVELFVGYADAASDLERSKFRFQIHQIEMTQNDAVEVSHADNQE